MFCPAVAPSSAAASISKRLRDAGLAAGGALAVGELRLSSPCERTRRCAAAALTGSTQWCTSAAVRPGAEQRGADGLWQQLGDALIAHPALLQRVVEGFPVHAVVVDEIRRHVRRGESSRQHRLRRRGCSPAPPAAPPRRPRTPSPPGCPGRASRASLADQERRAPSPRRHAWASAVVAARSVPVTSRVSMAAGRSSAVASRAALLRSMKGSVVEASVTACGGALPAQALARGLHAQGECVLVPVAHRALPGSGAHVRRRQPAHGLRGWSRARGAAAARRRRGRGCCRGPRPGQFSHKRFEARLHAQLRRDALDADAPVELLVPVVDAPLLVVQRDAAEARPTAATAGWRLQTAGPPPGCGRSWRCAPASPPAAARGPSPGRTSGTRCAWWCRRSARTTGTGSRSGPPGSPGSGRS